MRRVGGCKRESWIGAEERQMERGTNQPLMHDNNYRFYFILLKVERMRGMRPSEKSYPLIPLYLEVFERSK